MMMHNEENQHIPHWQLYHPPDIYLLSMLPELNALQTFSEQNDWHNDTPWAQALRLMQWVTELPESLQATVSLPEQPLASMLNSTNGRYSLHQLLSFVALIHDIGKAKTFRPLPDGTSRCPGHEAAGAEIAKEICQRLSFESAARDFVVRLVAVHGEPYGLYKQICNLSATEQAEIKHQFEAQHASYLPALLLLAYGDMITSHLQTINPTKFTAVSTFYRSWLQDIFQHE